MTDVTNCTFDELVEAVDELFRRLISDLELSVYDDRKSFALRVTCQGQMNGGDVEVTYAGCLGSHYIAESDPKSADPMIVIGEVLHREGFRQRNREHRLLAGPKLEAKRQLEAMKDTAA